MRRALVTAHLWLGLVLGLFWALQGLTGAALVFHREMDRWAVAEVSAGPLAPLDRIAAQAKAATGAPLISIGIADGRGDILNVQYDQDGPRQLQVETASGRPLRDRDHDPATPLSGSWWRWVYNLHEALLLHDQGETLVGISGLFLFSTLVMGLWLGWPKRTQWGQLVRWSRWRSLRAKLFGWHRLGGVIAGLLLLFTVPGGIWMIFAPELRPVLASVVPFELAYKPEPVVALGRVIAPDAALRIARERFPDASFVRLTMPSAKTPVYVVRLRQAGEIRAWSGVTSVTVDAASGRVLAVYDAVRAPLANRVADAAFSVHTGEVAGLGGRIAVMLAGLTLPMLYVTGIWAWLRRRGRRRIGAPQESVPSARTFPVEGAVTE